MKIPNTFIHLCVTISLYLGVCCFPNGSKKEINETVDNYNNEKTPSTLYLADGSNYNFTTTVLIHSLQLNKTQSISETTTINKEEDAETTTLKSYDLYDSNYEYEFHINTSTDQYLPSSIHDKINNDSIEQKNNLKPKSSFEPLYSLNILVLPESEEKIVSNIPNQINVSNSNSSSINKANNETKLNNSSDHSVSETGSAIPVASKKKEPTAGTENELSRIIETIDHVPNKPVYA